MEWISVKDRLPEDARKSNGDNWQFSNAVLTSDSKGNIDIDCYWNGLKAWESDNKDITHWMPLPEPPLTNHTMNPSTKSDNE